MKNGKPNDFLETIYNGTDLEYTYKNRKYWTEGYAKDNLFWLVVYHCDDKAIEDNEGYLINKGFSDGEAAVNYYVNQPIFDGKPFWDAEKDINWLY